MGAKLDKDMGRNNTINTEENGNASQGKRNNERTPWLLHCKNSHTEKLKMLIMKNEHPTDLRNLQENDLRFIASTLLQITQKPPQEEQTPSKHRTYQCPTCPYKGGKEEHLIRHRQKKRNV